MEDSKGNVVNHFEAGSNCQVFNGPVSGCVFAMPGSNVSQQNSPAASQIAGEVLDGERLARALKECKPFIWGNAAYSIPFCVCRDLFHLPNNAMSRNPWMRLHAGKWEQQGVMERVLRLRDKFIQEMQKE